MNLKRGIILALITAFISGFSIFLNGTFVVKIIKDPFVLTATRNLLVAMFLSSLLWGTTKRVRLKSLTLKQWLQLVLIGIIGGSIPFLLFFNGLSISQAAAMNGAFIHKTLFLWVAILAVIFLKEHLGFWQVGAIGTLLAGIYLLGGPKNWHFAQGERLIITAVVFWAIENVIAKIVLKKTPAIVVAWGRMFFGSMILLSFLWLTNRIENIQNLSLIQWGWITVTGILLFGYVLCWYSALKQAPATVVTSILTLGFPITVILQLIFVSNYFINFKQITGLIIVFLSVYLFGKIAVFKEVSREKLKLKYV